MFFKNNSDVRESVHYSGKDCHVYVEKLIRSSKELMIVSPYVDSYYADFLRRNSSGKNIMLLSSSIDNSALKVMRARPHIFTISAILFVLVLLDISEYYVGILNMASILATAFFAAVLVVTLMIKGSGVKIRRPIDFVHMKMYISDNQAIHGSANLTFSGMYKNVEHIEVISDPNVIETFRKDFMKLWNSAT